MRIARRCMMLQHLNHLVSGVRNTDSALISRFHSVLSLLLFIVSIFYQLIRTPDISNLYIGRTYSAPCVVFYPRL